MATVVFVFRGYRGAHYAAASAKTVIACFGSKERFADFFSGYAEYKDWMTGERFLGVWGARNSSRFRRLLAEWGGDVDVAHCNPPAAPHSAVTQAERISSTARTALEAEIKRHWATAERRISLPRE